MKKLVYFILLLLSAPLAIADVKLPAIFADNMVLQRDSKVAVWGWAEPDEEISVTASWGLPFGLSSKKAVADEDGKWKLYIKTNKAKGSQTLTIKGNNTVEIKDVLLGEVWLCSGQSNMDWPIKRSYNAKVEIANANYPDIRFFKVGKNLSRTPLDDCKGDWKQCSPETVSDLSAVAYFFGRKLHQDINVPIGLIHTAWGGTRVETWISKEATIACGAQEVFDVQQAKDEGFGEVYKKYLSSLEQWKLKAKKAKSEGGKVPSKPREPKAFDHNSPTALYNAMINPLLPFTVKGAIWYQGESNRSSAFSYKTRFPAMIANWRQVFENPDMPFYFVQLAPFNYRDKNPRYLPQLQEVQLATMLEVPNTGMVVTTDIGNVNDIHPTNKQDVGMRLAFWALAKDYGVDVPYSGPIYRESKVEGDKIRVFFDYVDDGLIASAGPLTWFSIAGDDNEFHDALAVIDGDTVLVSSSKVRNPKFVRFGYHKLAEPNLYNGVGLPASPFRTDSLP